ncbi:MAG: alpha-glucosidase [Bacteroidetes bacterium]|nr:alpha-glucosidase [Bacteroidota bacterium]
MQADQRKWWKEGIVYQIYPRSFQDSNDDGIGDLRGIINRLDYIKSLGVDIVWLNPIYASPNDDNGYDISDYQSIHPDFGTMADFDELIQKMHQKGLRLVMDLVINHTSDEHIWFQESKKSRNNPYRDFYLWWPAEKGKPAARYSYFDVNNDAWQYDVHTDSYYLHYFSVKQPDLNWENPKVREAVYDMMRWWFDKGIDGFRMDVISYISKDTNFPELPKKYNGNFLPFYAQGPTIHQHLQEMNRKVLAHYNCMTVGEAPGVGLKEALDFVDEDRKELDMFFHFDLMELDRKPGEFFTMRQGGFKLSEFKKIHTDWDAVFSKKGWGSIFLSNHDFPRPVSRWANDHPKYWYHAATMLHTFLLSMRGTPYVYFGDEIGMTNVRFDKIDDYRDIGTLNAYQKTIKEGGNLQDFFANHKESSRDNARVPMQWNADKYAGFSGVTPWIPNNPNFINGIHVAAQEKDQTSVLQFFKKMVGIRKKHLTLVYGQYEILEPDHEQIYAYKRFDDRNIFLVVLNFSDTVSEFHLPAETQEAHFEIILSNYETSDHEINPEKICLQAYQAMVCKINT